MFDISWSELLILGLVTLIFVGPKELPRFLGQLGRYAGVVRRHANEFRAVFEQAMREAEGRALSNELRTRLATLRELVKGIRERAGGLVEAQRAKLRERVERLLAGAATLDPARIENEIALIADRADATEEVARLESHFDQFERALSESGPVGRKLDFLLQEIGRELNTLGAKSPDAAVAHLVVEAKTELERIREQVQNVE